MRQRDCDDDETRLLYSVHGLRKNGCCCLIETGVSDADVGAILDMIAETARHYDSAPVPA